MDESKVFESALQHYGAEAQTLMLFEEMLALENKAA